MADRHYAEASLAALYDRVCEGRADFPFYLPLVMSAGSVLDVGCGTGALLHLAREAGHAGRLCGLDPAAAMLDVARERDMARQRDAARERSDIESDIEWVLGDLGSARWEGEFDLVVMTGHAFQVFVTDDELRGALAAVRSALTPEGRFVFETRNPAARAWERWTPENVAEVADAGGAVVRVWHEVETPVTEEIVSFSTTYTSPVWDRPQVSRSTLRFLDAAALSSFLRGAGLRVEEQFGDWGGEPLTADSPEIITVARRAAPPHERRRRNAGGRLYPELTRRRPPRPSLS